MERQELDIMALDVAANNRRVHIMWDGETFDIDFNSLDIGDQSSDTEVREAVASYLDVPVPKIASYTVDRTEVDFTLRPQAVFG